MRAFYNENFINSHFEMYRYHMESATLINITFENDVLLTILKTKAI